MATESDASCQTCSSDPNFAVICSFLERFSSQCGLAHPPFKDLQDMLENNEEVPQALIDLHIKLLRKARKAFQVEKWERTLTKFCQKYSWDDGWKLESYGYKNAPVELKLKVLKILLEAQFDSNAKFKGEINKLSAKELRLEPLGKDQDGQVYWCQFDPSSHIRVYREDTDNETWELVAKDRTGLVSLIDSLSAGEGQEELNQILKEEGTAQGAGEPAMDTGQKTNSDSESADDEEEEEEEEEDVEEGDEEDASENESLDDPKEDDTIENGQGDVSVPKIKNEASLDKEECQEEINKSQANGPQLQNGVKDPRDLEDSCDSKQPSQGKLGENSPTLPKEQSIPSVTCEDNDIPSNTELDVVKQSVGVHKQDSLPYATTKPVFHGVTSSPTESSMDLSNSSKTSAPENLSRHSSVPFSNSPSQLHPLFPNFAQRPYLPIQTAPSHLKKSKFPPGSKLDEIFKNKRLHEIPPTSQPVPPYSNVSDILNLMSHKFNEAPKEKMKMDDRSPEDLSVSSAKRSKVEVSEEIEEPVMLVKDVGSGKACSV